MTGVHLVPVSAQLGAPVPIADLPDDGVQENLAELYAQGITTARVSTLDSARLAAAVTPADRGFQVVIATSDTVEYDTPSDWVLRYRAETGLHDTRVLFVGGEACANLAAAADLATALITAGRAESVLWVTADRVASGPRFPPMSMTVFSDGAASCLFTRHPAGASFELCGSATLSWPVEGTDGKDRNAMSFARTILTAARNVSNRLSAPEETDRLLTPNFGSATRRMFAMAVPVPLDRLHHGVVADVGHCFAADTALNLHDLQSRGPIRHGDTVLALMSSHATMSGLLLRHRSAPDPDEGRHRAYQARCVL